MRIGFHSWKTEGLHISSHSEGQRVWLAQVTAEYIGSHFILSQLQKQCWSTVSHFFFFSTKDEGIVPWGSSGARKTGEEQHTQQCAHCTCACALSSLSSTPFTANREVTDNPSGVLQCCTRYFRVPDVLRKCRHLPCKCLLNRNAERSGT